MLKVSAGCPPACDAACTGTVSIVTNAPTSKKAKSRLLVFDRCKHLIWLNSLIIRSVLCSNFIVYFLSLHARLALLIQSPPEIVLSLAPHGYIADPTVTNCRVLIMEYG